MKFHVKAKRTAGRLHAWNVKSGMPLRRMVWILACLWLLIASYFVLQGLRMQDVYRVIVPHLKVREQPSLSAEAFYILEQGNHVTFRNEEEEGSGYTWKRIAFLMRPTLALPRQWTEGWVARESLEGDPFIEEETSLTRKTLLASNVFQWKVARRMNSIVGRSDLPASLKRMVYRNTDKVLHIVFMAVLGWVLFLFFLIAFRASPLHALFASVLITNAAGMVNECLDLLTGKGSFELVDLASNFVGSTTVLVPFLLTLAAGALYHRCQPSRRR